MSHGPVSTKKKIFSYAEAVALLPEVQRLTAEAYGRVEALQPRAEAGAVSAQREIEQIIRVWAQDVQERGIDVKGLWLVDFDTGAGYYCWRHPEPGLHFFHSYEDGFRGRIPVQ